MRNIIIGIFIALGLVFVIQYFTPNIENRNLVHENTALIEKQLKNVGKLIVTEGSYSQVYSYKDSKKFYFDVFSSTKKALVIVNAKAFVSYNLSEITHTINAETKAVTISNIPEPELVITPDIEYYDIENGYFNTFEAKDYNIVKERVSLLFQRKIEGSSILKNAKSRLISELQKMYIVTQSMGWTLQYNNRIIESQKDLETLAL